jgi:cellulase/cellobiase CelA1
MATLTRVLLLVLVFVLTIAASSTATAQTGNPLAGKRQFIDCEQGHLRGAAPYSVWPSLWKYQRAGDGVKAALLQKIARVPQVKWLAGDGVRPLPGSALDNYVHNVAAPPWGGPNCNDRLSRRTAANDPYVGDYPVFAIRILQHVHCNRGYNGGGRWNRTTRGLYLPWIEAFVDGLAPIGGRAGVILEPDGLAVIPKCLSRGAARQRLALMRAVTKRLGREPGITTYIDIGSSSWLRRGQALRLLKRSGVRSIRGFAINTTHFNHTRNELRYGNWLAKKLGGKPYVVNTAENGRGAIEGPKSFCNPRNAGLGSLPTTATGSKYADAYLWISRPGLSSNGHGGQDQCGVGPGGNVFWEPKAFWEAQQAIFGQPPWPPKPL